MIPKRLGPISGIGSSKMQRIMKCFETGFHADFTNNHSKIDQHWAIIGPALQCDHAVRSAADVAFDAVVSLSTNFGQE